MRESSRIAVRFRSNVRPHPIEERDIFLISFPIHATAAVNGGEATHGHSERRRPAPWDGDAAQLARVVDLGPRFCLEARGGGTFRSRRRRRRRWQATAAGSAIGDEPVNPAWGGTRQRINPARPSCTCSQGEAAPSGAAQETAPSTMHDTAEGSVYSEDEPRGWAVQGNESI